MHNVKFSHVSAFKFRTVLLMFCVVLAVACLLPCSAFADSEEGVRSGVFSMYETVRALAVPLAAAGISGSAVKMISGDVREASSARKRIGIILAAVCALWLIPAALSFGAELFSGMAWSPGG